MNTATFRARAHAQLTGRHHDPRRARLYAQLAFVASNDADAIIDAAGDADDARRLRRTGNALFGRATHLGFVGGTDAAFGFYCEICDRDFGYAHEGEERGGGSWICAECCAGEPCGECGGAHHRDRECHARDDETLGVEAF
jgi:hypothetical protein